MSEVDANGEYTTECIKLEKIYIVGALVNMIEGMFPWSTENSHNILQFKRNVSSDRDFMKAWHETLDGLLDEQQISLKVLMTAEMNAERLKSDEIAKAAKILRKPEAMITADELKFIQQRIAKRELARENPSSSS